MCKTDYGQQEAIAKFGRDPRVYETTVCEFKTDDAGRVQAAVTVKLRRERGENGRVQMIPVEGSEETVRADLVLIAAGFLGARDDLPGAFGLALTPRGTVLTNGHAAAEKVFCAGDMRRGQSLVVHAIAEGRAAAREIDAFLMGYTNLA